ncbi:MAG: pyridoxamine 5'-phosphate oxidase family protein [Myxococcales bacterium]|nr:pyridoxamine 5'-phosphate oxidase family protein [Myxococcales bacterium]
MIAELAPPQIEQVLHEQVIGRIGCHAGGRTYVVPITYVYDGSAILGHTGEGLKVRMMRENPEVCFEVEDLRQLPRWASVISQGRYEELQGPAADAALEQLIDRLGASPPALPGRPTQGAGIFDPVSFEQRPEVIFRIVLAEKTGRGYR